MSDMDFIGNRLAYLCGVYLAGRAVNEFVRCSDVLVSRYPYQTTPNGIYRVDVAECEWYKGTFASVSFMDAHRGRLKGCELTISIDSFYCWGFDEFDDEGEQPERMEWQGLDNDGMMDIASQAVGVFNAHYCRGFMREAHPDWSPRPLRPFEMPKQGDLFL